MQSRDHQTRDVRDVREQHGTNVAGDRAHARKVDHARVSAGADGDHFGPMFARDFRKLIVIDLLVTLTNAVMDDLEEAAGKIRFVAMG